MGLPLYKEAAHARRQPSGNVGLWFDKFCNQWSADPWTMKDGKLAWLKTLEGTHGPEHLAEVLHRRRLLIDRCGGKHAVFVAESRFVTGLGRSHPLGNGFVWHATLGTPYLPGSSIKGMVRAWTSFARGERDVAKEGNEIAVNTHWQRSSTSQR